MANWHRNGSYFHRKGRDVFIRIKQIYHIDEKVMKCKAVWVNLGYVGKPWIIEQKSLEIPREQWDNYIEFDPETEWETIRSKLG